MNVVESTQAYDRWLAQRLRIVKRDLKLKHRRMAQDPFCFLRGSFYRWAEVWPQLCTQLAAAPRVLGIGDLHVENFGTWRDSEGRLVWGINDFDEAATVAYTNDLVRLCTSALIAIGESRLATPARRACDSVLEGYTESLRDGGLPVVLAERNRWLRDLAVGRRDRAITEAVERGRQHVAHLGFVVDQENGVHDRLMLPARPAVSAGRG